MLSAAGLPSVVVKEMAQHASVTTTERYMHARLTDRARALDALPVIGSPTAEQREAATGTTGPVPDRSARSTGATRAQHAGRIGPHRHAVCGTDNAAPDDRHKPLGLPGLQTKNPRRGEGSSSEADGTRTRNHRIDRTIRTKKCPLPRSGNAVLWAKNPVRSV